MTSQHDRYKSSHQAAFGNLLLSKWYLNNALVLDDRTDRSTNVCIQSISRRAVQVSTPWGKTLSTALTYLPRQFCEYCFAWHFGFEGIALVHILLSNRSSVRIHVSIFSSIIVKSLFHALVDTPEECYPTLEQMTRATSLAYLLVTSEEQMSNMPCRAG